MDYFVSSQVGISRKAFGACFAEKWSFLGMDPHVERQICKTSRFLVTKVADQTQIRLDFFFVRIIRSCFHHLRLYCNNLQMSKICVWLFPPPSSVTSHV